MSEGGRQIEGPTEHCPPSSPHPSVVMVVMLQYREMMYFLSTNDLPQSTPEGHRREGHTVTHYCSLLVETVHSLLHTAPL